MRVRAHSGEPSGRERAGRRRRALVALAAYLAALAHLVAVPHVVCEHGDWIEARAPRPSGARALLAVTNVTPSSHEHCAAPALSRVRGGQAPRLNVPEPTGAPPPARPCSAPPRDRRRALLQLAPKQSPPVARS